MRKEAEAAWAKIDDLGSLYDWFESPDTGPTNWDIGVLTTRYPRTRPHDLSLLRLKGFLSRQHGNQMFVNDLDVYSIFEGDYDVDKGSHEHPHTKPLKQKQQSSKADKLTPEQRAKLGDDVSKWVESSVSVNEFLKNRAKILEQLKKTKK